MQSIHKLIAGVRRKMYEKNSAASSVADYEIVEELHYANNYLFNEVIKKDPDIFMEHITTDIVDGVSEYPMPENCSIIKRVEIDEEQVKPVNLSDRTYYADASIDTFYLEENSLVIVPTPDKDITDGLDVWYNSEFSDLHGGTAQAGAAATITLSKQAKWDDDYYNGYQIEILSGTGSGQQRTISDYVGTTRVATLSAAWTTQPDSTSTYAIYKTTSMVLPNAMEEALILLAAIQCLEPTNSMVDKLEIRLFQKVIPIITNNRLPRQRMTPPRVRHYKEINR